MDTASDDVPTSDDDLDDPLLRELAAAPAVGLREEYLPADTMIGQNYCLHRVIGAGAMGVVYEATDTVLSRRVALKVHQIGRSNRAARMWREARAMAQLSDPNVVTVHEVGIDGERGFIAMELVEGSDARAWQRASSRSWREIVEMYRQAGRGLAAAHEVGIIHRDFKPDNVLIGSDGRVRVADFGLASEPFAAVDQTLGPVSGEGSLTRTGAAMGTPAYMSPEQARREPVDARADQYSFCVALYEALHGARPHRETLETRLAVPVPRWLDEVIARGLLEDPAARYPDMRTLIAALDPGPRQRRRVLGAGVVGVAVIGGLLLRAGGWMASSEQSSPCADAGAPIEAEWNDVRTAELRATFASAAPAIGSSTSDLVEPTLADWAARWSAQRSDACDATRVRGEQSEQRLDARMDCYDAARQRFAAVVGLLAEGAPDTVARAEQVVARLPQLEVCARPEVGDATDEVSAEREPVHHELLGTLDRAAAELGAGRFAAGLVELDELIPRLVDEHFEHSLAEARRLRGETLLDLGKRDESVAELSRATAASLRGGDRDAIARAMTSLARSLGRSGSGYDEAERWLVGARELADALDWGTAQRFELDQAELERRFYASRHAETEQYAREMLARMEPDSSDRIRTMTLLATAVERQGRVEEALALHDEALVLAERLRGPDHPQVAMVLGNRTNTLSVLGRFDDVRSSLDRVLAIRLAVFGADAPPVGEAYRQLGDLESNLGHGAAAIDYYERAIELHRRANDETGEMFALANCSRVLSTNDELSRAVEQLDRAVLLAERVFGPRSARVAQLLLNRAAVRMSTGQLELAAAELERAVAIMGEQYGMDHAETAPSRMTLAQVYARLGRTDEALGLFDAAYRVTRAGLPSDSPRLVDLAGVRGQFLHDAKQPVQAAAAWRESVVLADRLLPAYHSQRIKLHIWLGEELIGIEEGEEALHHLELARELDAASPEGVRFAPALAPVIQRARTLAARRGHSRASPAAENG